VESHHSPAIKWWKVGPSVVLEGWSLAAVPVIVA